MASKSKPKFRRAKVHELLGITPICTLSDRQIWNVLTTPMLRALLGDIVEGEGVTEVRETAKGDFAGDEVTNLNDHRLYGGKEGFVRNRYINTVYKTKYGRFIVKRDGVKVKAMGWFGDPDKGGTELIFKASLRDRRFDGTKRTNDSSLLDFEFDDPTFNSPLTTQDGQPVVSCELSVYCFMPGSRVADATGEFEYEQFIANPFKFLDRPELFKQYFDRVWTSKRAPGQVSNPVPDVSKMIAPSFEKLAKSRHYDFLENAPSHYHVAMWAVSVGYKFRDPVQQKALADLTEGLKKIKASGLKLTRSQESWVCVLQSLREDLIPAELNMHGAKWPQDNIGPQNLWMYKPLNEKAAKLTVK